MSASFHSSSDAVGFVLAGGQSTRMGQDKALVQFAGRPLVAHAVGILQSAGLSATIAGARSPLTHFSSVLEDAEPDHGPLQGICTALESISSQLAVFLPVDLPLLPPTLLTFMLAHARITAAPATLASINGFTQSFPAVISKIAYPALLAELRAGRRGSYSACQAAAASLCQPISVLAVESLAQSGHVIHPGALPVSRWFLNVNAPDDLLRAKSQRASHIA
jgi:molybdenum cofactor guanylyltransferase